MNFLYYKFKSKIKKKHFLGVEGEVGGGTRVSECSLLRIKIQKKYIYFNLGGGGGGERDGGGGS